MMDNGCMGEYFSREPVSDAIVSYREQIDIHTAPSPQLLIKVLLPLFPRHPQSSNTQHSPHPS